MPKIDFRRPRSTGAAAAALLLVFLTADPRCGAAQSPPDGATQKAGAFIQTLGTQAIDVLGPSIPEDQRVAMFHRLLTDDFDLPATARFVLGAYARELTPQQRQQFLALFSDALAQSYADRLGQYAGEPFQVTGVRNMSGATLVSSEVRRRNGPPMHIDWQVTRRGDGRFVISDVEVDGVSEKMAQRSEFEGIIQRNGGQPFAVIAALRQELAQAPRPNAQQSAQPAPTPDP